MCYKILIKNLAKRKRRYYMKTFLLFLSIGCTSVYGQAYNSIDLSGGVTYKKDSNNSWPGISLSVDSADSYPDVEVYGLIDIAHNLKETGLLNLELGGGLSLYDPQRTSHHYSYTTKVAAGALISYSQELGKENSGFEPGIWAKIKIQDKRITIFVKDGINGVTYGARFSKSLFYR